MFRGGEELSDSEMLTIFKCEFRSSKLEFEDVTVVINLILSNDLEFGFDWRDIISWNFFSG